MTEKLLASISFDDIDSRLWGCTTHLAGLFLVRLSKLPRVELADYPLLVRLNPAIPWKTRGNAAVVIRVYVDGEDPFKSVCEEAWSLVGEYTSPRVGEPVKKPGIACMLGEAWRSGRLRALYNRALRDVVVLDYARITAEKAGVNIRGGRGVIGATAALAALPPGEPSTFELVAYRQPGLWGGPRCIDHESAARLESKLPPCVFNNFDPVRGRLTAAPGGPDPVLAGFRGTCPRHLASYSEVLCEEPHFWVLYRSNQHTDAHAGELGAPRPYKSGTIEARVSNTPRVEHGGHVLVPIIIEPLGQQALLAVYRESGYLNRVARLLQAGDRVRALVNVRPYGSTQLPIMTVEKLWVLRVSDRYTLRAPRCPKCGHRMKSLGRGRGYRCPKCGYTLMTSPIRVRIPRMLAPGVYTPGPGRLRHLTAPWPEPTYFRGGYTPSWGEILSTTSNPPVSDPPASSGSHHRA